MKLATVERILSIMPIEGADKIVLATVLGWQVVIKKEEFQVGDLCVYIPIDTIVNPTKECFKFLVDQKNPNVWPRINTIRLKGKHSQGLVVPLDCLDQTQTYQEGTDVSEQLDVKKYEKESLIQASGTTTHFVSFPAQIVPITDEDNLRTKHKVLEEFTGKKLYVTQKMDGSSMTLIYNSDGFVVCSRRLILDTGAVMYQWVSREKIDQRIIAYNKNLAIQGEFCGPKVNGNQMGLKDYKYIVFNIKNLDTGKFYGWNDIKQICQELGLEPVPLVCQFEFDSSWTISKFQELANQQTYTQDYGKKVPGEGIVIRPEEPVYSNELNKMLSVKVINQNYKD